MRDLIPFLRLYKKHWFGLTLGMLLGLATVLASMGLLTLSGWFISAAAVAGLSVATRQVFNYMLPAGGVRGFSIARTAGRYGERIVSHNATFKLLADIRLFFFRKLAPLVPGNLTNLRDGDLLNRLVADVNAMDHIYLRLVSPLLIGVLGILAISGFLIWFDPSLGGFLATVLLVLLIGLPVIFYGLGKGHGESITLSKAQYRVGLLDWLQGNAELRIFGANDRVIQSAQSHEEQLLKSQRRMASITGIANATLMAANGLTLVAMLWFAADGIGGRAPDPLIAMFAFATMASFELLMPVSAAFQYLGQTLTSARRLNEIIEAKPATVFSGSATEHNATGAIEISNVSFTYHGSCDRVLSDISLNIEAGQKIAILGRTGCGKSTLLQLLTRSWDPQQGQISFDGIPLADWNESSLRNAVSVVSQRVDIFSGTLRYNLAMANESSTDEKLREVLNEVGLEALLEGQGLDAWVGEGGRQLSGGERRRIGIARALLRDAPILLLDEPTEGLDSKTEKDVLSSLMSHAENRTLIYITHRLAGLGQMDQICLMDNGEIIEQGTHEALLNLQGRYAELTNRLH